MADDPLLSQLLARWEEARERGEPLTPEELVGGRTQLLPELRRQNAALVAFDSAMGTAVVGGPTLPCPAPATAVPRPRIPGYEVLGELGSGGMGVVWKARQVKLDRLVALKMIRAGPSTTAEGLARFRHEAEAVARLGHPNIVQIFEVGEQDGCPWIALEFVEGGSLDRKLGGAPQEPREAARLVETLTRAVHHAHQRGIVHRDLKPGKILLANAEIVTGESPSVTMQYSPLATLHSLKITDFGLAKRIDLSASQTQTGAVLGTPSYMAPEQTAGKKEVGPAADVYALGAILYDLLTGRPPFRGESAWDTVQEVLSREPFPPRRLRPSIPRDLETICLKCLEKDPARRYASALALADDLGRFLRDEPIAARPVGPAERLLRWCRRNPVLAAGSALAAAALLGVAVVSLLFALHSRRAAADLSRALDDARKAQRRAEERLAENSLDRGLSLCEAGDADLGLLWLARALVQVPADSDDLEHSIRIRLNGWQRELFPLVQCGSHRGMIRAAAFSPDGKTVALASGKTARFFDVESGRDLGRALEHGPEITALAWARDGKTVATGGEDGAIRFWSRATGKPTGKPLPHPQEVLALAYGPDGNTLATAFGNPVAGAAVVRLYTAGSTNVLADLPHPWPVWAVAFTPKGDRIVTGGGLLDKEGEAYMWSVPDGRAEGKIAHPEAVLSVGFSPDGKTLATGAADGRVRLWTTDTRQSRGNPLVHEGAVRAVSFSQDGRVLLTGSVDHTARLWDVTSGRPAGPPLRHRDGVMSAAFSPDGRQMLTAGWDRSVRIWDFPMRPGLDLRHRGPVDCVAFSPDGKTALTGGRDKVVWFWSVLSGWWPTGLRDFNPIKHPQSVSAVSFSPDGKTILTVSGEVAQLWEPATRRPKGPALRHGKYIAAASFSPDGKRVATASHDTTAQLWDAATGLPRGKPLRHDDRVNALAFSPDGKFLLTGSHDQTARLWSTADGRCQFVLRQRGRVQAVAFSPRGDIVASAGMDGPARRWETATGRELEPLPHDGGVAAIAFSPDGTTLATAGFDHAARLWDAVTGRPREQVLSHKGTVMRVVFSRDGRVVATGSADQTARLWDVRTGRPLGAPVRHQGLLWALAFSPDDYTVLTASLNGPARLWARPTALPGDPQRIQAWVEVRTGSELRRGGSARVLDPAEWRERRALLQQLGGPPTP
jgi:WD40 repeat protein